MITITLHNQSDFVEAYVDRNTTASEFVQLFERLNDELLFSKNLNVLIKAPEKLEKINCIHVPILAKEITKATKNFEKINIAFTVSRQREIELTLIFKNLISYSSLNLSIFSCVKDAKRWLRRTREKRILQRAC